MAQVVPGFHASGRKGKGGRKKGRKNGTVNLVKENYGDGEREFLREIDLFRTATRRTPSFYDIFNVAIDFGYRKVIDGQIQSYDRGCDEIEFKEAMELFRKENKRLFPTCHECLEVLQNLGYKKIADKITS